MVCARAAAASCGFPLRACLRSRSNAICSSSAVTGSITADRTANAASLDDCIGTDLQRPGYRDSKRSGRPRVDDELEFRRLLHREVTGSRTFENPVDVRCEPEIELRVIHRVGEQTARFDELP